jgi:hypothetical protein
MFEISEQIAADLMKATRAVEGNVAPSNDRHTGDR